MPTLNVFRPLYLNPTYFFFLPGHFVATVVTLLILITTENQVVKM